MNSLEEQEWASAFALALHQYRSAGFANDERTKMAVGEADEAVILIRNRLKNSQNSPFHVFADLESERKNKRSKRKS